MDITNQYFGIWLYQQYKDSIKIYKNISSQREMKQHQVAVAALQGEPFCVAT